MTRNNEIVLFEIDYWNEYNPEILTSTYERASLVPAAAVIPALVMYRIIVAIKKFVVGLQRRHGSIFVVRTQCLHFVGFCGVDSLTSVMPAGLL